MAVDSRVANALRRAIAQCVILTLSMVMLVQTSRCQAQPDIKALPKAIPDEAVKAWASAYGKAGFLRANADGITAFHSGADVEPQPGDMPAFTFERFMPRQLSSLPDPGVPFALDLRLAKLSEDSLKDLAVLKSLERLYLARVDVSDKLLDQITSSKSLQVLFVVTSTVTGANWQELERMESLHTLDLRFTNLTDMQLKQISGLGIHRLLIGGTKITDAGLPGLATMPRLNALEFGFTAITNAGLKELTRSKSLHTLNLQHTKITDDGVKELAAIPNLRSLDLLNTSITENGLKALAGRKLVYLNLPGGVRNDRTLSLYLDATAPTTELELKSWSISAVGLKHLREVRKLTSLSLEAVPMSIAALKEVGQMKELKALRISTPPLTDAGLEELAGLTKLESLNFDQSNVTGEGLRHLTGLKQLRKLSMRATGVTVAGLKAITGLPGLRSLDLEHSAVKDAGLSELAPLKSLEVLSLRSTAVTDKGLRLLAGNKNLRVVLVRNTKVTDVGIAELQKALPKCTVSK